MTFNINEPYECRNGMPAVVLSGDTSVWRGMVYSYDRNIASRMDWTAGGRAGTGETPFDLVNVERKE